MIVATNVILFLHCHLLKEQTIEKRKVGIKTKQKDKKPRKKERKKVRRGRERTKERKESDAKSRKL